MTLARDGAYMYGDRRVSRAERSKWRLTFRSLAAQAQSALHAADTRPAEQAVEQLIDLACEIRNVDYFHSAPQLIRWESGYGWTRGGDGKVAENETRLTEVLEPLLTTPDMWRGFAVAYLFALDAVARKEAAGQGKASRRSWGMSDVDYIRKSRAETLAIWHAMLAARLADTDGAELLDRLASHRVLLVTSANLTQSGVAKNLDSGLVIRGGTAPGRAAEHIDALRSSGSLVRLT